MISRSRSKALGSTSGYGHKYIGANRYRGTVLNHGSEVVNDQIDNSRRGKVRHHPFSVIKTKRQGLINYNTGSRLYVNFLPLYLSSTNPTYVSIPGSPSDAALTAELLAKTNPSMPKVDVPAFLGELKDLPMILRDLTGNLAKDMAAKNLSYHFGIKPLVKDLVLMLNWMQIVRKRAEYIKNSAEGKIRKRRLFAGIHESVGSVVTVESSIDVIRAIPRRRTLEKCWGYVIYEPELSFPDTPEELWSLALKAAYGLNFDIASAWELMPWSWLIDWFTNIGDVLNAQRNIVPLRPKIVRICRHSRAEEIWEYTTLPVPPHIRSVETKLRTLPVYSYTAEWPALTSGQLNILGSIAVLKQR